MDIIKIDINSDVGEGVGNEEQLLPLLSSCNIACGGHAGNSSTIREVVKLALRYTVKIGAHPSYPDKENFGRTTMVISSQFLIESIQEQLQRISEICKEEHAILHHIKPHGALYNDIAANKDLAKVFLTAIKEYKEQVKLYVPYNSVIAIEALKQNFQVINEAFLDRNYTKNLGLVARSQPNALLEKPQDVLNHLLQMVKNKQVKTVENTQVTIHAETYCIHGDTSSAYQILMYLHKELSHYKIEIKK